MSILKVLPVLEKIERSKERKSKIPKSVPKQKGQDLLIKLKKLIESCHSLYDIIGNSLQIKKQEQVT